MPETTVSRQTLRRRIGQAMRMQFYVRYGAEALSVSSEATPTTLAIPVSNLTQDADFWNRAYLYLIGDDTERRITDFSTATSTGSGGVNYGTITIEWATSTAVSTAATVEITSIFPPSQIHSAINQSIREAAQYYSDQRYDGTLGFAEDLLEYDISGLSPAPFRLLAIYGENTKLTRQYNVTAAGATSVTSSEFSSSDFGTTEVPNTDWLVSIYKNTGRGQIRGVRVTSTAGKIDLDASTSFGGDSWTTNPDTTSYIALWNPNDQNTVPTRIPDVRTDAKDFPGTLYFSRNHPEHYGQRMFVVYLARPSDLTVDTAETVVPEAFITDMAQSLLHKSLMSDNRYDLQHHATLSQEFERTARTYAQENPRRTPPGTLWQPQRGGPWFGDTVGNPMDWGWAD